MAPENQAVRIQLSLLFHGVLLGICYGLDTVGQGGHRDDGQDMSWVLSVTGTAHRHEE